MTAPSAARTGKYGSRVYPVARGEGEDLELVELPSVSNVLKVLDQPNLNRWKLRTLAEQLSMRPDLIMLAGSPDTRNDAIRQALDADRSRANQGTGVHGYAEAVDDGTLNWDLIPTVARPWIEQYMACKDRFGWTLVEKEVTVANHTLGYAGTADRYLDIPGYGVVVADLKTGKSVYPDQALQLALYARAEFIWESPDPEVVDVVMAPLVAELDEDKRLGLKRAEDGKKISAAYVKRREASIDEERSVAYARLGVRRPMPEGLRTDVGFIIHVSDTSCELIPMNLEGSYDAISGICAAYHWGSRRDIVGKPLGGTEVVSEPPVISEVVVEPVAVAVEPTPDPMKKVTLSFSMEPTGENPVAPEPSDDQLFASLRSRLTTLFETGQEVKDYVSFNWPTGVPGLRTLNHSHAQLQSINDFLSTVELRFSPFPVTEEKAVQIVKKTFPGSVTLESLDEPF
jgi:hypothetical protein